MATGSDADDLRAELAEIGERRTSIRAASKELAEDTKKAIAKAKGLVPMTEVARLVCLERTSMYNTYGRG